jgi:hypothetical protein
MKNLNYTRMEELLIAEGRIADFKQKLKAMSRESGIGDKTPMSPLGSIIRGARKARVIMRRDSFEQAPAMGTQDVMTADPLSPAMARVRAKKERQQVRDRAEARRSLNNQAIDRVSAKKKAKDDESFGAGI